MSDERRKVLEMLEEGKITEQDAARLLVALGESGVQEPAPEETEGSRQEPEGGGSEENTVISINSENGNNLRIDADGSGTPKLTLYPEGDDALADEISRTVENTIEQGQKEHGNDWNAIGEKINNAVTEKMNAVFGSTPPAPPAPPTPPTPPTPPVPPEPPAPPVEACNLAELTEPGTPYQWNIGSGELNSLSIDWMAGQVEIKQGGADHVVVTEYSKRPLKEDERMHITFEDGEMNIRFTEKKRSWGFARNLLTEIHKKLVVELPLHQDDMEEIRVNTASAGVSIAQIAASLDELEVNTASGGVSLKQVSGDDIIVHTASGAVHAEDVTGDDISIHTASGSIWAKNIQGDDFKATAASGSLSLEGIVTDDMTATAVSGNLKAQNFTADDASLKTVSGSLYALGMADEVHAETVSGGLELHVIGEADGIYLHTVSANLQLFLPETVGGFTANYTTTTGRFESEFPTSGHMGSKNGCAVCGEGEMEITLNTMSGNMKIRKE